MNNLNDWRESLKDSCATNFASGYSTKATVSSGKIVVVGELSEGSQVSIPICDRRVRELEES